MYYNNKILVGKNDKTEVNLLLNMANRHGIITGASGSGKTITLKVLAESFSAAGVPVFLVDVKGDLAGMSQTGTIDEGFQSRLDKLNLESFEVSNFPTTYWDVYGEKGHPIRTTISKLGSRLLSRMLGLTDAQEGVLAIVFKIAEDENLEIVDLKDLRAMLAYVGEKRKDYTLKYGNVSLQSIGSIQRSLLTLEQEDGDYFFGKPALDIKDFTHYDAYKGYAHINILDAVKLFQKPTLYSSFLLWILTELYNTMPEVGDLDKPKFVLFIDEAHLLFKDIPEYLLQQIIQIVKLIRSKGVGLYFISQSPSDIPDEILSQLGNRIQHVLRYYTKSDAKAIKAACDSFRENSEFDMEETIKTLATGEAIVSFLDENGSPSVAEKVTILSPQSKMGTIDHTTRQQLIKESYLYNKYENRINEKITYEKLQKELGSEEEKEIVKKETKTTTKKSSKSNKKNPIEKAATKLTNRTINTLGNKIGNAIFKGLFK